MKSRLILIFLCLCPFLLSAESTLQFKDEKSPERTIKYQEGILTYSALKGSMEAKRLGTCEAENFRKLFNRLLQYPSARCPGPQKKIILGIHSLKKEINDCTGPLPRFESVLSEILSCP